MSIREGRGRPRKDYPTRSEDKNYHGRGNNPPSRHLWVGNLPHNLMERDVAHYFLQFGELESVAFQLGRCYAFINYINAEDAFAAIKELQGFVIDGNPLRIEFAKAEKTSMPPRDADYERRDNPHHRGRGSPFSGRDSRMRHSSPEFSHSSKSKMNDKNAEPSEVLWVGFPAQLNVDEFVLRKAFSPFGDIEKITAFPGRSYAFVRFRDLMAACRAKETLHGKLFGNPRVHICFARSDSGTFNRERHSINAHPPLHGRDEYFEHFRSDRDFDLISGDRSIRSPLYVPNLDRGDRNKRNTDFDEQRRFSPSRPRIREFSPRQGPIYDDRWDLPEDVSILHGTKKLKTNTFPTDNDLPEYPLSDLEKSKRGDIPQSGVLDSNFDGRHSGYGPFVDRGDRRSAPHDDFQAPIPMPPVNRRSESSSKEVWRWEGMIAKGGSTVCRARCFPVGKPPDLFLPEVLDCTARTSLDMLAKHYYQASSISVVFLAPANDPDISYYNEFMSYLEEKQRAAVVKLNERTTLFLVPPSEFSVKVLKVPGKLSISGVVLRLDPLLSQNGNPESSFVSFQTDPEYRKPVSPPSLYLPPPPPPPSLTGYENLGYAAPFSGNIRPVREESDPPTIPPSPAVAGLPSNHLGQLASSLRGRQSGVSSSGEYNPSGSISQSGYNYGMPQSYELSSDQQTTNVGLPHQISEQDEAEADPQKRLEATLQLAAALLQQIQQGKGT